MWRTRWAAVGAAAAVTLGAGGLGIAHAAVTTGSKAVYVPITPCRLLDTRPGTNVGPRNTPIGANAEYTATVHGSNGNCTIPAIAVGIVMNTTVVNGTASSFLTVFPAGATRPNASSMNWVANQPPTPNEISVKLSSDGKVTFYNLAGTVDVLGDVVGYYADHTHGTGQLTLPAQALNFDRTGTVIVADAIGLTWQNNFASSATLSIHRPADWTGTGNVNLTILVRRKTTAAGNLQFFSRPRNFNDGDPYTDVVDTPTNIQTTADTDLREFVVTFPATALTKEWWDLTLQRNSTLGGAYTGDVVVSHIELTYDKE